MLEVSLVDVGFEVSSSSGGVLTRVWLGKLSGFFLFWV